MRILGGWSNVGWYVTCALLSVCARPPRGQVTIGGLELHDLKSMVRNSRFGRIYGRKSSGMFRHRLEGFDNEREVAPSTISAIVSKINDFILVPMHIEPEAEMLPSGFKGVRPPGVTHMEIMYAKPQNNPPIRRDSATLTDVRGPFKFDEFDQDPDKGEHSTFSGKSKSYSDGIARKKGMWNSRRKLRNVAGYRDVNHPGETKKDADLYDKGRLRRYLGKQYQYDENVINREMNRLNDDDFRLSEAEAERMALGYDENRPRNTRETLQCLLTQAGIPYFIPN